MKYYFLLSIVFVLLSCSHRSTPQIIQDYNTGIFDSEYYQMIKEASFEYPDNTQLSIALIADEAVEYLGFTIISDSLHYTENKDKVFEIGSISKVFTSVLLANLIIEDKLQIDDPISKHFGVPIHEHNKMTIKELSNHTSGLPRMPSNLNLFTTDPLNPFKAYGADQLREYFAEDLNISNERERSFAYSNLGAGTLGYILTKVSNSTYEQLLVDKITSPYKMSKTTTNRMSVEEDLVRGQNYVGQEVPNWDFDVLVGAGGILSSVEDLTKFAFAQFDNTNVEMLLSHEPTFASNEKSKVGLGWMLRKSKNEYWLWHNGGTMGYRSSMALSKDEKKGVVILTNVSAHHKQSGNIDQLCFELLTSLTESKQ